MGYQLEINPQDTKQISVVCPQFVAECKLNIPFAIIGLNILKEIYLQNHFKSPVSDLTLYFLSGF